MIKRQFLAADTALLPAMAEALVQQAATGDCIDLRDTLVVLPTTRSIGTLRTLLLEAAHKPLLAPDICTIGALAQRCIVPTRTLAPKAAVHLAWQRAVQEAGVEHCTPLIGDRDSADVDEAERSALAARLAALCDTLETAMATPADVASIVTMQKLPVPATFWMAVDRLRLSMRSQLEQAGLDHPGEARMAAINAGRVHPAGVRRMFVVTADPSSQERALLRAMAGAGVNVHVVVHGNESNISDRFTPEGFIQPDQWLDGEVAIIDTPVHTCAATFDQPAVVLHELSAQDEVDPAAVTIVAADPEVIPALERACASEGVHVHAVDGRTVMQGRIGLLLHHIVACLDGDDMRCWGAMLRHGDIASMLPEDALTTWDDLWSQHLPAALDASAETARDRMGALLAPVRRVLRPLFDATPAPASKWAATIARVLQQVFDGAALEPAAARAMALVEDQLQSLYELPEGALQVRCIDVVRVLCDELGRLSVPGVQHPDAIECVGWLDAHLDTAPRCFLLGFNQGVVPTPAVGDPWLPTTLRSALELPTTSRRIARDTWLMHALLQSGRQVDIVVPGSDAQGTPLLPSRLLLGQRGTSLAGTIQTFVDPPKDTPTLRSRRAAAAETCGIDAWPLPEGDPRIESLSVTAFGTWLFDRWRFLVEQDRRIKGRRQEVHGDLDPMGFGTFVHDALDRWGREEADRDAPTTCADAVRDQMLAALDAESNARFGRRPRSAVRLQQAIVAHRLCALAPHQAASARDGWHVRHVELSFGWRGHPALCLPGDATAMPVTGRIDRVDQHPTEGWRAWDYKTGASTDVPAKAHRSRNGWKSLQLPLYKLMLASIGIEVAPDQLGFIRVTSDDARCGLSRTSGWNEDVINEALAEALDLVSIIREGRLIDEVEAWLDQ